jgi:putative aldouronate transport system substrate-binding protein
LNLRKSKVQLMVLIVTLAMVSILSACSKENTSGSNASESKAVSSPSATESATATDVVNEVVDPLGKFDPPIEVKIGRSADGFKFDPGESIDKNRVYDFYERELGVKLVNEWIVPGDQYAAKTNVAISSGNIPDVLMVDANQLRNLVEADLIEDLTDVYQKYVSADTRKTVDEDGGYAINAATVDGKLYAFPAVSQGFWTSNMLWIRQDWLDKLGLQPPKTMDELIHVATEFVKKKPDGVDTYGLGLTKELTTAVGNGFFNSYHAYPFLWIKDNEGKIAYGGIQPEIKTAVLALADMYKAGLIDKEFGVKDYAKVTEAIVSGKLGMVYGSFGYAFSAIKDLYVNNPDAVLKAYPLPSADGSPAKAYVGPTAGSFWVVKKGFKHPEAVVKLANFFTEHWMVHPNPDYGTSKDGIMYWQYTVVPFNSPLLQVNEHRKVKEAFLANESADTFPSTSNEHIYLKGINDYLKNPKDNKNPDVQNGWMYQTTFGTPNSGAEVLDYYFTNGLTVTTPLKVPSTPTMAQKMPTLTKMEEVFYTKVILGEAGAADFDKFVADWKKQGGDEITAELNNN